MKVEQEAINKETGIYYKNPTRLEITEMAETQQDIVDAMRGTYTFGIEEYQYFDEDETIRKPLMGITKMKEMNEEQIEQLLKTIFRYRSNIVNLHLKLGEYPNKKKVNNNKVAFLNGRKKIIHSDVAKRIADIVNDGSYNIVEIKYTVSKDAKNFFTKCEIYSVNDSDYENEELFSPAFGIEYYRTH